MHACSSQHSHYLRVSEVRNPTTTWSNPEWLWLGISPATLLPRSAVSEDGLAQALPPELVHVTKENLPFLARGLTVELSVIVLSLLS